MRNFLVTVDEGVKMVNHISISKNAWKIMGFATVLSVICITFLFSTSVFAAGSAGGGTSPANSIGAVADTVIKSFASLAKLITAVAYVAGMGFAIGAIMKFKAHKDNPTQVPIGTPIALIFIAAALIFLPTIFTVAGATLFGSGAAQEQVGGTAGKTSFTYQQ